MKITIQGNYMRALFAIVNPNERRAYLSGVYIDGRKDQLIASDGHRALLVPVDVENSLISDVHFKDGMIFAIPRKPAKTDMKVTIETGRNPERYEEIVWSYYDKHGRIREQLISQLISGKFPDIRKTLSDKFTPMSRPGVGLNPVYLFDVFRELGFNAGAHLKFGGSTDVIKVDFKRDSRIEYYIMPMRY